MRKKRAKTMVDVWGEKKTKNTKINKPERKQGENESSWWTFDINMADIGEREKERKR